jgi:hypothetical protein
VSAVAAATTANTTMIATTVTASAMGLLTVGPESAGAVPGPVCYGRGGTQPTVTDADLLLGYLSPDYFLGGEMGLDRAAMESAQFGRAKDRIGQIGASALSSLKDRSTAGGRSNSGLEARDRREIVSGTQGQLGEVVRDQAIDALGRADQIDDRNLATGVAQRSQDIGMRGSDYAGNIQQRGQDYNALLNPYQNPLMQMVPSLFGMFAPRY